ncbi:NAD(P)-binding protein [Paraphoma chrysanthemicola]|uniref:NAD(P)-binding protein n=1 Tax=Paraphoma chrysanthemicola TaxID=798071 RepID=A0A8K0RHP4_9PLEO|nr:NAD(P)-binding protein [Paraphoma chrysanthemicola]
MSPKLFITGGTGYIGGSVLHAIATTHPEYTITVLLRTIPASFTTTYPNIRIVGGTYDSTSLLTSEASQADIVVHNGDSDHEPSLNALIAGLLQKEKQTGNPGVLIHLSGTGIVSDFQTSPSTLGTQSSEIWSDIDATSLQKIRSRPDAAPHRNTEKILHAAAKEYADKINIAIMCPPDIYGPGTGLGRTSSALIPLYVKQIKKLGAAFYVREGTNTRSWVHIQDLTRLYLRVVETAVSTISNPSSAGKYFNENGYYFASTQEHTQIALARAVGAVLHKHGVIEKPEPRAIGLEEVDGMLKAVLWPDLARYLFASNSRTRAERAGREWGWKGEEEGLLEAVEKDILVALKEG